MNLEQAHKTPYAWPGGYRIRAWMDDGAMLCNDCLQEPEVHEGGEPDGWRVEDFDIYWEGPSEPCGHCGKLLDSEYGDPDAEEEIRP